MPVCTPPEWVWSEPYVIFVKLGCVMGENVYRHTPAVVLCKMPFAWSAREVYGIMVVASLNAPIAMVFYAKMTNLNIKPPVRFWKVKTLSVNRAIDWVNTLACVARHATVRIMSDARALSTRRTRPYHVQSAIMRHRLPRI